MGINLRASQWLKIMLLFSSLAQGHILCVLTVPSPFCYPGRCEMPLYQFFRESWAVVDIDEKVIPRLNFKYLQDNQNDVE